MRLKRRQRDVCAFMIILSCLQYLENLAGKSDITFQKNLETSQWTTVTHGASWHWYNTRNHLMKSLGREQALKGKVRWKGGVKSSSTQFSSSHNVITQTFITTHNGWIWKYGPVANLTKIPTFRVLLIPHVFHVYKTEHRLYVCEWERVTQTNRQAHRHKWTDREKTQTVLFFFFFLYHTQTHVWVLDFKNCQIPNK